MNVYGAEKVSDYFGQLLQEEFYIPDRRNEKELSQYWNQELIRYYEKRNH